MQRRTFLGLLMATAGSLGLAGCGFRLRGWETQEAVIDELDVAGSDSELARLLVARLTSAGTRVHDQAPMVVNLGPEQYQERQLGVLDRGPREMEAVLRVPFSVQRRRDGAYAIAQQQVQAEVRFVLNDDNLLGHDELREEVRQELQRDLLRQLVERLRALDNG